MAAVRQWPSGRWQLIVYVGRDRLTRKKLYERKTVDAAGKRDAKRQAEEWEVALLGGQLNPGSRDTFNVLFDQWLTRKERAAGAPSTLRADRNMIDTYLRRPLGPLMVDHRVTTPVLDDLYADLAARGGACRQRPCPPPRQQGATGPCGATTKSGTSCRRPAGPDGCGLPAHAPGTRAGDWVCPTHNGACATWEPCTESPCEHGAPLSGASVRRLHAIIRGALSLAVIYGWIRTNPAVGAEPGRALTGEVTPPTNEDIILLLAEAEAVDRRLATYLALAIEAGARRGAMHALRWSYWTGPTDTGLSEIRFPNVISLGAAGTGIHGSPLVERPAAANKRGGRATLGPHVTAALAAHHDTMFDRARSAGTVLPADAFVFTDDIVGAKPWHPDATSHRFARIRRGLHLDDKTKLHHMRHLMATQLLATPGISPAVVQDRGGWAELHTMLRNYTHALPANDVAAAGVVDRIIHALGD